MNRAIPLFVSLFLATVAAAEQPKIKVLLVEGVSNHDWRHRADIVRSILAADGSFEVDVSFTPSTVGDPAWAAWQPEFPKYDVVMSGYNNLGGKPPWPTEVQRAFTNYVASGGGFFCYHEANNSFSEWPEYSRMIGLGWRNLNAGTAIIVNTNESLQYVPPGSGTSTSHGARVDVLVKRMNNHPIHAGLPMAWMAADIEIYRYARGPATNVTVISYAMDPSTQLQFPIEWVVPYGRGHCYASSYGHVWSDQAHPTGTRCAAWQTLMVRALKWLAKRDPGNAPPADFPTTNAISLRAYTRVGSPNETP